MPDGPADRPPHPFRSGVLYALAAYGSWGMFPLYFRSIKEVPAFEILQHRILWSLLLLAVIVGIAGRWADVRRTLATPRLVGPLIVTSLLIGVNWLLFIVCIETEKVAEASLGYFITPLMQVLLGMVVLRERLRPLQSAALVLAIIGVAAKIYLGGEMPMLAISLAVTFSIYALFRKQIPVDGLLGLTIETLVLALPALAVLLVRHQNGWLVFGHHGWHLDLLIAASGFVTALPLLCFGQAARRLPLAVLGFLQFVSPTLQFAIAVAVFGEPMGGWTLVSFAILWAGLALFVLDSLRSASRIAGRAELAAADARN
jgi:chloramphenicol-sensitive protein RarD